MIRTHRIAASLTVMVAGTIGLLAASPAAFAETVAGPSGGPAPVQTVLVGGMPGWQVALIAIAAALVAATCAVLVDRARAARHQLAPAS